jgi:hypothetical protein
MRITLEGDDRQTLIARLGLSSDASDDAIIAAVTTRLIAGNGDGGTQPPADPPTAPATQPAGPTQPGGGEGGGGGTPDPTQPGNGGAAGSGPTNANAALPDEDDDDVEVVDAAAYRALVARAVRSDQLEEDARIKTRNDLVESAIKAGKFPPARREHYRNRYDTDAEATTAAIERMAKNVVPVKERGVDVSESELEASDAYPREWVTGGAVQTQPTPNGSAPASRIHTED